MTDRNRREILTGMGGAIAATMLTGRAGAVTADVPGLDFVYEAIVTLEPTQDIGPTPLGTRRRVPITGGHFAGPRIRGTIMAGGADWQLQRADDWTVIEADYMMRTDDGTPIHVRNTGLTNSRVPGATSRYLRTIPSFEVPEGPHDWFNQAVFVGTLGPPPDDAPRPSVRIRVYRVT